MTTGPDAGAFSVRAAAREAPDRPGLVFADRSYTFAELASAVLPEAAALSDAFQETGRPLVHVGDRTEASLLTILAAFEAGVPLLLIHPRWTETERSRALARSGARDADLRGEGLLALIHTSGSTGVPKAVALSRTAFLASARASEANLGRRDEDRWLLAMTPAHVGGLSILTRCLSARTTVVAAPPGRFDATELAAFAESHRVTLLSVVPTMLSRMLEGPMPTSLRTLLVGGAAVGPALQARAEAHGLCTLATYGLTELCSQVATQRPDESGPGAPPLKGMVVKIREGEIHVGGPSLFSGVLEDGRLAPARLRDGLYPTGDLGRFEGGRLFVDGRADDRIVTGGENVDPAGLEQTIESVPGVGAAVVFGTPDPEWGEVVSAAIVPSQDGLETDAVEQALRGRVAPFRLPRRWHVLEDLPKTASGKINRRAVIEALRRED